jgi:hypothetical protein
MTPLSPTTAILCADGEPRVQAPAWIIGWNPRAAPNASFESLLRTL